MVRFRDSSDYTVTEDAISHILGLDNSMSAKMTTVLKKVYTFLTKIYLHNNTYSKTRKHSDNTVFARKFIIK